MLRFFLFCFFNVRLLSVLCGHSVFSSSPQRPITSDFDGFFYPRFYPLHLFSYPSSWERASIFPFKCSVLNKGTTGTIFNVFGLTRSWLWIEPRTSRMLSWCFLSNILNWSFENSRWRHFFQDGYYSTCQNRFKSHNWIRLAQLNYLGVFLPVFAAWKMFYC